MEKVLVGRIPKKVFQKDLVIPSELLNEFRVSVRIIDKKHLVGIKPIDVHLHDIFKKQFPRLYKNESFVKNYELAMVYKGRSIKSDLAKLKVNHKLAQRWDRIIITGIPIPWQFLKRMDIDYRKFDFIYTPRM